MIFRFMLFSERLEHGKYDFQLPQRALRVQKYKFLVGLEVVGLG